MTSEKSPPSGPAGPAGSRGRQRPAPTIDLKATEVASEPAAAPADKGSAEAAATGAPSPEPEAERPAVEPEADAAPADARARPPFWSLSDAGRLIAAGVAGAAVVLLAFAGANWFVGQDDNSAQNALGTRLARLESQVRDLAARPATQQFDPKAIDKTIEALAVRMTKLETAAATSRQSAPIDPTLDNRIATLEGALSALGERVGVVARRTDDINTTASDARARIDAAATALAELQKTVRSAPPAIAKSDLDALASRIAALEKSTKALEAALAKRSASADDRSARLSVTAALLKAAVERGDPFAAELGAAKSLAPNPNVLTPLDAFAATGVPAASALARELTGLAPRLEQAAGAAAHEGGFLDRLQANAEKLVRVRPIDGAAGDTAEAIVSRVEARAAHADIANALAELEKLPAPMRAPAQAWIAKAQARQSALEASRRFAADALAALGQSSP